MTMSDEEQCYIVEQIDKLIHLAKKVASLQPNGSQEDYEKAKVALEKQRKHILAMDGIEYDY